MTAQYCMLGGGTEEVSADLLARLSSPHHHSSDPDAPKLSDEAVNICADLIMREIKALVSSKQHHRVYVFNSHFMSKLLKW